MLAFILSYLGGALTILAPCILPVLPFVFARADQPFARSGLPLLAGMGLAFTAVASLGAAAGEWAVHANAYGRWIALGLLALAGLTLLLPGLAERLSRPFVAIGSRLADRAPQRRGSANGAAPGRSPVAGSFLLGVATGLLWSPCAGPILGLILTGAALQGPNVHTSLLLLTYALGALSSLAAVLLGGGRVLGWARRFTGTGEVIKRGLGVAVLAGVAAVALGVDTGALAGGSATGAGRLEQALFDRLKPTATAAGQAAGAPGGAAMQAVQLSPRPTPTRLALPVEGRIQPLDGAVQWLNSPPLTAEQLRGKVVLIDFWTFDCINCRNALPHVRDWHRKYKDQGLVVIGVHTPEYAFEKDLANVKRAVADLGVQFPVAVDNQYAVWRAFNNQYWPALYFVDAKGQIRHHHFGEGAYERSEQVIQQLLEEAKTENTAS